MSWRWAAVGLLVAACGGEAVRERPPEVRQSAILAPTDIATELTRAMCMLSVRCQTAPVTGFDRCVEDFPQWSGGGTTFGSPQGLQDAVLAHRVSMDPVRARECMNEIPLLACDTPGDLLKSPPCASAFTGIVLPGEHCIIDEACAPGALCLRTSASDACDGRCMVRGERCREDGDCGEGEVCEDTRCVPADRPAGGLGQPCGTHDRCIGGLACVADQKGFAIARTCRLPPTEGEPCASGDRCAEGLRCMHAGNPAGTCTSLLPPEEGGACEPATPWTCGPELLCIPDDALRTGTCRAPHVRDDACASLYDCGGLFSAWICDTSVHRCIERPATGRCVGDSLFGCDIDHSFCDLAAPGGPTCRPFRATGDACQSSRECGPTFGGPRCADSAHGKVCLPRIRELCDP